MTTQLRSVDFENLQERINEMTLQVINAANAGFEEIWRLGVPSIEDVGMAAGLSAATAGAGRLIQPAAKAVGIAEKSGLKSVTKSGLLPRPTIKGIETAKGRINSELALKEIASGKLPATKQEQELAKAMINKNTWFKKMPKSVQAALGIAVFGVAWYAFEARGEAGIASSLPKVTEEELKFRMLRIKDDLQKGYITRDQAQEAIDMTLSELPDFKRDPVAEALSGAGTANAKRREAVRKEIEIIQGEIQNIIGKERFNPLRDSQESEAFRQRNLVEETKKTQTGFLGGEELSSAARLINERQQRPIDAMTPRAANLADTLNRSIPETAKTMLPDDQILERYGEVPVEQLTPELEAQLIRIKRQRGIK